MKLIGTILSVVGVLVFGEIAWAQTPSPSSTPLTQVRRERSPQQASDQFGRSSSAGSTGNLELRQRILQVLVQPLYRRPKREELIYVTPDPDLKQKFSSMLSQENTGIFKLLVDFGCAENVNVISAAEKCRIFSMPGAGNSYSFRMNTYRIRRLADLTLTDQTLHVTDVLAHGILVNLGDVSLETLTLQAKGMKFLTEFQPAGDMESAQATDKKLIDGIREDGFFYSRGVPVEENTTYVLRSIAYDGKVIRAVRGITYNELDFDKRKDVIIAFRVVRRDVEGNLTLIWKELKRQKGVKLRAK